MHIANWKEPARKYNILYDSNYVNFWKKQNYRVKKKSVGVRDLGLEVRESWISEIQGTSDSETILDGTAMKNAWHYAFVKTHGTLL